MKGRAAGCVQRTCNLMNGTESEQSIEEDIIIKRQHQALRILFNFGAGPGPGQSQGQVRPGHSGYGSLEILFDTDVTI